MSQSKDVHELFSAMTPEEQGAAKAGARQWYAAFSAGPPVTPDFEDLKGMNAGELADSLLLRMSGAKASSQVNCPDRM